ncbi:hypothetical protein L1887_28967 [Cichorium endivia]|nr:hypothetical protein L1887_28967 [Cichorium endivia]
MLVSPPSIARSSSEEMLDSLRRRDEGENQDLPLAPCNDQWELANIKSTVGDEASVMLLDGSVMTVSTTNLLPANPEFLISRSIVEVKIDLRRQKQQSLHYNIWCWR